MRGVAIATVLMGLSACEGSQRPAAAGHAQAPEQTGAQSGMASFYGPGFAGEKTASGEPHRPEEMTAASRTLPLGTVAKVTNQKTGQSVAVEVNDRGPYAGDRILDVSEKAATRLGMKREGVTPVKVQPLPEGAPRP